MKNGHLAIVGFILTTFSSLGAYAGPAKDPHSVDILGLRLGMKPDEVTKIVSENMKDSAYELNQGTLSNGEFTTPNLIWSAYIGQGAYSHRMPFTGPSQYIRLIYNLKPQSDVLYIERTTYYERAVAPSVDATKQSLIEKYGEPSAVDEFGDMIWTYNTPLVYTRPSSKNQSEGYKCKANIGPTTGSSYSLVETMYSANLAASIRESFANCGTWMVARTTKFNDNGGIASGLFLSIGDLTSLQESYVYMNDVLKKGAADKASVETKKASSPHFSY